MTIARCAGGCGKMVMSAMADDCGQVDSEELYCDECYSREAKRRDEIVYGYEHCWRDRYGQYCRKPKGHDGEHVYS